jgi:hypothetical protein
LSPGTLFFGHDQSSLERLVKMHLVLVYVDHSSPNRKYRLVRPLKLVPPLLPIEQVLLLPIELVPSILPIKQVLPPLPLKLVLSLIRSLRMLLSLRLVTTLRLPLIHLPNSDS